MKGLLWLLAVFAAAVGASMMLQDGGYVVLVVPPRRIEVSLVLALLVLVAAFIVGYMIVRLASHALALPSHVRSFRARQRELAGLKSLFAALQALFEGRYGQVEKHARKAWDCGAAPALTGLVAARAAQRRRDFTRRDEWMKRVSGVEPEWRRARMAIEAEQLVEERRFEEARTLLRELHAGGARHIATLQLLLRCEQALGHWDEAVRLARVLEKREALPPEAAESLVIRERTTELSRLSHDSRSLAQYWHTVPQNERTHPRIAAAAARAFMQLGDCRSAHRLIEDALERTWESELVLLYGERRDADALTRIQRAEAWLAARPRDPELLLTLGRLCTQCELWGKAQSYLEASLAAEASKAAHVALATLFDRLGRTEDANRQFRAGADTDLAR
jgi:HemY protein